jgi:hypothetical protein
MLLAILVVVPLVAIDANASGGSQWFSAWAVAQGERLTTPMSGTSVRMIVGPTISGNAVRIKLESTLGQSPVVFSAAYIGQLQSDAAVVPGSNTQVTFNGSADLALAAGEGAYSDPVPFQIEAFARYAISLDVTSAEDISAHSLGLVTNYMAVGAHAADPSGTGFAGVPNGDSCTAAGPTFPFYRVAAVDVESPSATGTIVAFGDSITDGECSIRTDGGGSSGARATRSIATWLAIRLRSCRERPSASERSRFWWSGWRRMGPGPALPMACVGSSAKTKMEGTDSHADQEDDT